MDSGFVHNCPIMFFHVVGDDIPKSAWLIRRIGRLTAGVQYEPQSKFFCQVLFPYFVMYCY